MSHLNIAPSPLYGVLLYCLVYILIIISYFGGAGQKSFSRYHCELRPCGSLRELVTLSVTQGDYAVHLLSLLLRDGFTRKNCCSFGFCPNEGGGPCPNFSTFSLVHFWSIKGVYANNLNIRLFFVVVYVMLYIV